MSPVSTTRCAVSKDVSSKDFDVSTLAMPYSTCALVGTLVIQVIVALERVTLLESMAENSGGTTVAVMVGVALGDGLMVCVTVAVRLGVDVMVIVAVRVGVRVMVGVCTEPAVRVAVVEAVGVVDPGVGGDVGVSEAVGVVDATCCGLDGVALAVADGVAVGVRVGVLVTC